MTLWSNSFPFSSAKHSHIKTLSSSSLEAGDAGCYPRSASIYGVVATWKSGATANTRISAIHFLSTMSSLLIRRLYDQEKSWLIAQMVGRRGNDTTLSKEAKESTGGNHNKAQRESFYYILPQTLINIFWSCFQTEIKNSPLQEWKRSFKIHKKGHIHLNEILRD